MVVTDVIVVVDVVADVFVIVAGVRVVEGTVTNVTKLKSVF